MRKRFSEKYGHKNIRDSFQINSIDDDLKNRLWNLFKRYYIDSIELEYSDIKLQRDHDFFKKLFDEFFKSNRTIGLYLQEIEADLSTRYFSSYWYEIYDLLEYTSASFYDREHNESFRLLTNKVLEDEMSGYRFIDEYIAPIVDETEINEIEEAMSCKYNGVKQHLSNALDRLSDRENPDYINSIKESISAVEAVLNLLAGTTNIALNRAINKLPFDIEPTLEAAFVKLYSWTSSSDGIRHGHTGDEIKSSFEEAKFMLVSCSAFVNYAIAKSAL